VLRRTLALPAWPAVVYPAALLLALVLPFEAIQPVLVTPWLSLTDEKVVLLLAVVAWVLLGRGGLPSNAEWRAVLPSLALLLVALVAALFAPEFGDEALRFVWRLAAAAFILLLVVRVTTNRSRLTGLLWAIILGAGLSGLLGIGEAAGWPLLNPLLGLFKVAPTWVAGELRVSASFQYATIAAMYFEMAVPLAIVLAATATRRWRRLLALAIAAVCTVNVALSLSRAGILTLGLVVALLLVAGWLKPDLRRIVWPAAVSAGILVGSVAILAVRNPVFDMRLVTESDADWYGAAYSAPAALSLVSAEAATIALDVRNEGRITWSNSGNHPFALGYRWLTADGTGVLDVPPGEVALTRDVAPGETIHLQTLVQVPPLSPGAYRLDWGMLQRDVLRFYERGSADAETVVDVTQARSAPAAGRTATELAILAVSPRDDGEAPWVVGRLELWGAALRLIQTRPLLGVGPDNFRHLYGAQLGLETWDERVQANNLYLEVLTDIGLLGLAAFLWVVAAPLRVAQRLLNLSAARSTRKLATFEELSNQKNSDSRQGAAPGRWARGNPEGKARAVIVLGVSLGVVAFLVHGLLDSFLAFTPTALLLWMLLGMLLAQKPQVSGR
jgi:hypothetical protein